MERLFIRFCCLLMVYLSLNETVYTQYISDNEKMWKHVVTIDRLAWQERGGQKNISDLVDNENFIRRIYLDITGKIPTYEQLKAFHGSKDVMKRQKIIDELLNSKGYVSHLVHFWRDLLRHKPIKNINHDEFTRYLERMVYTNKPYDEMVREMLTAEGTIHKNHAVGLYLRDSLTDPMDTFNATVRAFLGVRIGCAQCHNHRFDKWTQKEFYESASFLWGLKCGKYIGNGESEVHTTHAEAIREDKRFKKLGDSFYTKQFLNPSIAFVRFEDDNSLYYPDNYQYDNAKPGEKVKPRVVFKYAPKKLEGETHRSQFANWLTSNENPMFARVMASRLWKRVMGVGLVEPLDDLKDNADIQNPLLFEELGNIMIDVNYDIKAFLRIIYNTEAYQYSFEMKNNISQEDYKVQGAILRRMSSQQLNDSLLTLRLGDLDRFSRLDQQYFEFEDKMYEVIQDYVDTVKPMLTSHKDKYIRNTKKTDPAILDLMVKTAAKIHELEDYYDINEKGYLKKQYVGKGSPLISSVSQNRDMTKMTNSGGSQLQDTMRRPLARAHFKGSKFMEDFGALDRSAPETSVDRGSSLKQILLMINSDETRDIIKKDSYLMKELFKIKSMESRVSFLYYSIYGRSPTGKDMQIAKKFFAVKDSTDSWANYSLALINSPEFYFIK